MLTKDLSITFCGVKFPNPFCLSSSPVGNCYEMCAKAYDTGWGGVVFKTIGFFIANEVSPRFDHLVKEDTGFIGFKKYGADCRASVGRESGRPASAEGRLPGQSIDRFDHGGK